MKTGGDDELYNFVRGKSTMMIQRMDEDSTEDYVPQRRVVMMTSSKDSDGSKRLHRLPKRTSENTEKHAV
jgi:hypothetical protein